MGFNNSMVNITQENKKMAEANRKMVLDNAYASYNEIVPEIEGREKAKKNCGQLIDKINAASEFVSNGQASFANGGHSTGGKALAAANFSTTIGNLGAAAASVNDAIDKLNLDLQELYKNRDNLINLIRSLGGSV